MVIAGHGNSSDSFGGSLVEAKEKTPSTKALHKKDL